MCFAFIDFVRRTESQSAVRRPVLRQLTRRESFVEKPQSPSHACAWQGVVEKRGHVDATATNQQVTRRRDHGGDPVPRGRDRTRSPSLLPFSLHWRHDSGTKLFELWVLLFKQILLSLRWIVFSMFTKFTWPWRRTPTNWGNVGRYIYQLISNVSTRAVYQLRAIITFCFGFPLFICRRKNSLTRSSSANRERKPLSTWAAVCWKPRSFPRAEQRVRSPSRRLRVKRCRAVTKYNLYGAHMLTLSLPRVINVKFPLQPHQKYYITQHEELGITYSDERWLYYQLSVLIHLKT